MWYLLENEADYKKALKRFEEIKYSGRGTNEHKEKMLLVKLISEFENMAFPISEIDPIEMIKIRMEEFGFNQNQLGNKSTISKVLNYKQPLSLKLIRDFSQKLKIPAEFLVKDYQLKM